MYSEPTSKKRRLSDTIAHSALSSGDKLNGSSPHESSGQEFGMYAGAAFVDGQQRTLQGKAKTKCCLETSPSEFWHEASAAHEVYHAGFGASMEHEQFCCTGPSDWTGLFS